MSFILFAFWVISGGFDPTTFALQSVALPTELWEASINGKNIPPYSRTKISSHTFRFRVGMYDVRTEFVARITISEVSDPGNDAF
jgi:hypothetical protein